MAGYKKVSELLDDVIRRTQRSGITRRSPGQQRYLGLVTNAGAATKFLDTLFREHAKLVAGSMFAKGSVPRFDLNLVNTATTRDKDGRLFRYYDVVDRGRGAVRVGQGRALVFATPTGARAHARAVGSAPGEEITLTALAQIRAIAPALAVNLFREWLNQKTFQPRTAAGRFKKGSKAVPLGNAKFNRRAAASKKAERTAVAAGKKYTPPKDGRVALLPAAYQNTIIGLGPDEQKKQIELAVIKAEHLLGELARAGAAADRTAIDVHKKAVDAALKENQRVQREFVKERESARRNYAYGGRLLGNIFPQQSFNKRKKQFDSPIVAKNLDQASRQVQNLLRKTTYAQLVAIFEPLLDLYLAAFQNATPTRVATRNYKMVPVGVARDEAKKFDVKSRRNLGLTNLPRAKSYYAALPPETGGQLRASYVFLTDGQFDKFVQKASKK